MSQPLNLTHFIILLLLYVEFGSVKKNLIGSCSFFSQPRWLPVKCFSFHSFFYNASVAAYTYSRRLSIIVHVPPTSIGRNPCSLLSLPPSISAPRLGKRVQNWQINKLKAKVEAERRKLEKAEADEAAGGGGGGAGEASRSVRRKLLDEAGDRESENQ